jgi:drug/metabolite transporter (DMT)-like permease
VTRLHFRRIDALLFLMAVIWGTNYAIIKHAFRELDPQAFNAIRMVVASAVFLAVLAVTRTPSNARHPQGSFASIFYTPSPVSGRDWLGLAGLGLVGQCFYQYLFVGGLAATSVSNAALILAATPVLIALVGGAAGEERVTGVHWLGALLSLGGIYLVVGRDINAAGSTLRGDLTMFAAVCCWAIYTLGSRPLMLRHSPVAVSGLSMAIGTALYVPAVASHIRAVNWAEVSRGTWVAAVYSALFALCLSYTIWYAAVRELGSARTSAYSNVVPIVAMTTAVIFLGEPMGVRKIAGAVAVLVGVALTRVRTSPPE